MGVTGVRRIRPPEKQQFLRQVDRIVTSHVLHGSESLCKLLRYLAEHALAQPDALLKEYQIATEVFGRPADFDPQSDSAVRVQAGRLRLKLAEYYSSEGSEDAVIVKLPKGTYVPTFSFRRPALVWPIPSPDVSRESASQQRALRNWGLTVLVLSTLLVATLVALLTTLRSPQAAPTVAATTPDVIPTFWRGFLSRPEEPWVIFSNGAFVGRPETGMRYFNADRDSRNEMILDHYTGVGEVLAVHELDRMFGLLNRHIRVKRGSLFTLDDAKTTDLIFVGSPAENLSLREIPNTREFIFQRLDSGARKGELAIANAHPQSGEPKFFVASASNAPLTEDYSVIALVHGLNPRQNVLILAGTTTIGTQAAVEFVCQQTTLERLLELLHVPENREMKPFEAVLRVKVARGVPVEENIVAHRIASGPNVTTESLP